MADDQEKSKIIIDEDWKSQVQSEKEKLREQEIETPEGEGELGEMPAASITYLVTTLATQAMAWLGQIPDPTTGRAVVHLDYAKLQIDTIEVLQEKTKGNLDEEETELIDNALHQLRMLFVEIQTQVAKMQMEQMQGNDVSDFKLD